MKRLITILLLTLFTGVVFSQGVIYPDTGIWKRADMTETIVVDSIECRLGRVDTLVGLTARDSVLADSSDYLDYFYPNTIVTLSILEQYSQVCYDDSTAVTYKIFEPWENIIYDRWGYIRVREDSYEPFYHYGEHIKDTVIYEHTLPTFIGFIEWLKERE